MKDFDFFTISEIDNGKDSDIHTDSSDLNILILNMSSRLLNKIETVSIVCFPEPQAEMPPQLSYFINDVHWSRKFMRYLISIVMD